MTVLWTEWPNTPALARITERGIEVLKEIATETEVVAGVLGGICDVGTLVCSKRPRWAFQLSDRICVQDFGGHDVLDSLRQLAAEGRYKALGEWKWTPGLHALYLKMQTPTRWSLEFADGDGTCGAKSDNRVQPCVGRESSRNQNQ